MIKKESFYTNDGELVTSKTTRFAGRFNEIRGYAAYYKGKMIMSHADAVFPNKVSKNDVGDLNLLSLYLKHACNFLKFKTNKGIRPRQFTLRNGIITVFTVSFTFIFKVFIL